MDHSSSRQQPRTNLSYSHLEHVSVYRSWLVIKGIYLRNKTQNDHCVCCTGQGRICLAEYISSYSKTSRSRNFAEPVFQGWFSCSSVINLTYAVLHRRASAQEMKRNKTHEIIFQSIISEDMGHKMRRPTRLTSWYTIDRNQWHLLGVVC